MTSAFNILLVDDDVTVINALRRILSDVAQLHFATSGADALRVAHESVPDLVLMDVEMPGISGYALCAAFKSDPLLADVPIIFITSHNSIEQEVAGLSAGAVDFIGKPPSPPIVLARVRTQLRMKEMTDMLRRVAITDGLTGVANRRRFDEVLASEWARAHRNKTSLALLLADVDHFKAFNDCYGHQDGDRCLAAVAGAMRASILRTTDLVARYGGEEFAVILPDTDNTGAYQVAARLLSAVDALKLTHAASSVADHVTLSIGASVYSGSDPSEETRAYQLLTQLSTSPTGSARLVAAADRALYAAKHNGRRQAMFLSMTDIDSPEKATRVDASDHSASLDSAPSDSVTKRA